MKITVSAASGSRTTTQEVAQQTPTRVLRLSPLSTRVTNLVAALQRSHLMTSDMLRKIAQWEEKFRDKYNDPESVSLALCDLLFNVLKPILREYADNQKVRDQIADFEKELMEILIFVLGPDVDLNRFLLGARVANLVAALQRCNLFTPEMQQKIAQWAEKFKAKYSDPERASLALWHLLFNVIRPTFMQHEGNDEAMDQILDLEDELKETLQFSLGPDVDLEGFLDENNSFMLEKRSLVVDIGEIEALFNQLHAAFNHTMEEVSQEQEEVFNSIRQRLRVLNQSRRETNQAANDRVDALTKRVNELCIKFQKQAQETSQLGNQMLREQRNVQEMIKGYYERS